ncbi:MAG: CHASE2 domain-containing protein [Bacteroidota bacterium]
MKQIQQNNKVLTKDTFLATIFSIVVVAMLSMFTLNTHIFDPFKRAFEDFRYTDLYFSKIKQTNTTIIPDIILINVGKLNRAELAKEIEIINRYRPKIIGIDVVFRGPKNKEQDSLLANVINNSNNIVLASKYEQYNPEKNAFCSLLKPFDQVKDKKTGFINIGSDFKNTSTIRYFISNIKEGQDTVFSFATQVAMSFNPSIKKDILSHNSFQTILYSLTSANFIMIDAKDVFTGSKKLELIKDRIVLMGYLGEPFLSSTDIEDKHFTPFNDKISGRSNPDMFGVVINANIVLMLLDKVHLHYVWGWVSLLITFILTFFHVWLFMILYKFYHKWYHVSTKIIQLLTSTIILLVVFYLYHYWHLYFEPAFTVVVILFTVDLIYFYEGLIKLLSRWFKVISIFNSDL